MRSENGVDCGCKGFTDAGPRATGGFKEIQITDCLIPWDQGSPVLMSVPGSPLFYIPIFTTLEKLESTMERAGIQYSSVKQIQDGREFMAETQLPNNVRIMHDPWFTDEGRVRWAELALN